MDTNKNRKKCKGYRQEYLRSALSDQKVVEFLGKYNKRGERKCLLCSCKFISKGYHNRKCDPCKAKEKLNQDNQLNKIVHEYKHPFITEKVSLSFRG